MLLFLTMTAFAGYGDPLDGQPTRDEREVHLWVNAVRAEPAAFESEYQAYPARECSVELFSPSERDPKPPLPWNHDLASAGREHSRDMLDNGARGHASSDGRSPEERIRAHYDGNDVGETVAFGFPDLSRAVLRGLICSPEHRAILLGDRWDELGAGVADHFVTIEVGRAGVAARAITVGVHRQEGERVALYADWYDPAGYAPDRFEVFVDGVAIPLDLTWGSESQGVWSTETAAADCTPYYFEAELGGEIVRYPEQGAYGWGSCAYDDAETGWFADRYATAPAAAALGGDSQGAGCGWAPGGGSGAASAVGLLALLLFRRSRARPGTRG